ncbi:MAG: pseudouridine synthase, partial [Puniceicoccales bacterium]
MSERHYSTWPLLSGEAELIDPEELKSWIVHEDEDVLVIDKPGWIVCHPSKNGPWSSLVGACRELTGLETLHLVARLDRETSGLVLIAKRPASARRLQMAFQERRVEKTYLAIMAGEMTEPVLVNQPLAKDLESQVAARVTVRKSRSAQKAVTQFEPLVSG